MAKKGNSLSGFLWLL